MRRGEDSGFVLIGVVVMVLALTILGLSLFSLSSYEAQFMNRSLDSEQALQCAMGGLDRARFVLATAPDTLGMVKIGLPRDSVIWARASQVRAGAPIDTSGYLEWNGSPVTIEVTARYGGVVRTVRGSYHPNAEDNYYKRLLTASGGVHIQDKSGFPETGRCGSVVLQGRLWLADGDSTSTLVPCASSYLVGIRTTPAPPVPAVASFIASHLAAAQPFLPSLPNDYNLWGTSGAITYYRFGLPAGIFSIFNLLSTPTISVEGRAVMLLPQGARFASGVQIVRHNSDPNACLVVVAGPGDLNNPLNPVPDPAIWFFNAISSEIPIILVSNGTVLIEHFSDTGNASVGQLSIFANNAYITGPKSPATMTLSYDAAVMDPLIDTLMVHNALPNSTSASGPFTFLPGTWRADQ